MNRSIIVTGISGTGKTTVCNTGEKLAKQTGEKVNVITYGAVMVEMPRKHKEEMDRDAMRKADFEFQCKLQKEAVQAVSGKNKGAKEQEAAREILKALETI